MLARATVGCLLCLAGNAWAQQGITIQGRLADSASAPVLDTATQIRAQIVTADVQQCILYDETKSFDLSKTDGAFSFDLNQASPSKNVGPFDLPTALSNGATLNIPVASCPGSTATLPIPFLPAFDANRRVLLQFKTAGGSWESLAPLELNPAANAVDSSRVGGVPSFAIPRIEEADGTFGTAVAWTASQFSELAKLASGSSSKYVATGSSGAQLLVANSTITSAPQGSLWYDKTTGSLMVSDGGSAVHAVGSAGGGSGTVTGVTSANADISVAASTSAPVLTLNAGTGANQVLKLDGAAKIPAVDGSALTNLSATKIGGAAVSLAGLTGGNFLKYSGTAWVNAAPSSADLSDGGSLLKNTQISGPCLASQTLTFSSPTGTWTCSSILVSSGLTGVLPLANGGTGSSNGSIAGSAALTLAAGGIDQNVTLTPSGTGSVLASGNVGIGTTNTTSPLTVNGVIESQTGGIKFPDGTVQSSAAVNNTVVWNSVTGDAVLSAGQAYILNSASRLNLTLPTTCTVGKQITISSINSGGWKIVQPNAASVIYGATFGATTTGTSGYIRSLSSNGMDSITLTCVATNNAWSVTSLVGSAGYCPTTAGQIYLSSQALTVPYGCVGAVVKAWGAGGSGGTSCGSGSAGNGGGGGFAQGTVALGLQAQVYVKVGGGGSGYASCSTNSVGSNGGDVVGFFKGSSATLANALVVAGSGGAGGAFAATGAVGNGGAGGGSSGIAGSDGLNGSGAGGGTQSAGGAGGAGTATGQAGSALSSSAGFTSYFGAGGPGGGYYGGGTGGMGDFSAITNGGGGGGGSGYVIPSATGIVLTAGSGATPANTGDPAYGPGIGTGGLGASSSNTAGGSGGGGMVVVYWQ